MNRRDFLRATAAVAAVAPFARAQSASSTPAVKTPVALKKRGLKKGFMLGTLGGPTAQKLTLLEKFQLLRAAGFDGVEVGSGMNQAEVLAARAEYAEKTALRLRSRLTSLGCCIFNLMCAAPTDRGGAAAAEPPRCGSCGARRQRVIW